jgi:hypothetical protein
MTPQTQTHVTFKDGETLRISVYGGDVRSVELRVEGDGIPLKVGESFTCSVVSVTREVTER